MGAFDYVKKVYREYANFDGRARREEFWYFILFFAIVSFVLSIIDGIMVCKY